MTNSLTTTPISVGLSANPNIQFKGIDGNGEKGSLEDLEFQLTGSSPNISACLVKLKMNPTMIVPFELGPEFSKKGRVLDFLLDQLDYPHVRLKILRELPFAVSPIINGKTPGTSILYGKKGLITEEENLLFQAEQKIKGLNGDYKIVTGIDLNLVRLGFSLLGDNPIFVSFSPHHSICGNVTVLKPLLEKSGQLILNYKEFQAMGGDLEEIHSLGVNVIIITNGEHGGCLSVSNASNSFIPEKAEYSSVPPAGTPFLEGMGDCFNGAQFSYVVKNKFNFREVTFKQMREACNFAAKITALKSQVQGASNYPDLSEISF